MLSYVENLESGITGAIVKLSSGCCQYGLTLALLLVVGLQAFGQRRPRRVRGQSSIFHDHPARDNYMGLPTSPNARVAFLGPSSGGRGVQGTWPWISEVLARRESFRRSYRIWR